MEGIIRTLDRYFEALKDQERDWDFFIGIVDYVNLLDEIPQLKGIIERLTIGEKKFAEGIREAEKLATEELKGITENLLAKIKRIKNREVVVAVQELKDWEEGKNQPGWYKSARLNKGLDNLIRALIKDGHGDSIESLFPGKDLNSPTLLYDATSAYPLRAALSSGYQDQKETELWGNYRSLRTAAETFQRGKEHLERLKNEGKDTSDVEGLVREREIIRNDGEYESFIPAIAASMAPREAKKFSSSTDSRIREFKRNKYQNYTTRVHNYLQKELSKETIVPQKKNEASFDEARSVLIVNGKEVGVKKFSDQYHFLRILFEDPKRLNEEWFFSTMAEKYNYADPGSLNDKKFYNAAYQVDQKLLKAGVKDFFAKRTGQSFRINPTYFPA